MAKVEFTKDDDHIRTIKINGLIHLWFYGRVTAFHSYIDAEVSNPVLSGSLITRYFIEFFLSSGQTITAEYDNRELWEEILKGLK